MRRFGEGRRETRREVLIDAGCCEVGFSFA